ncbi:hypothetical protein [Chakrabartyella piscis]|uniref:hypothetical protein n=1 Tax=Chakrabartyella piscis TaxID=2918914 RepID=UPI00295847F0|nr:hypothetical protein [Chakrabartyella piscis]
MSRKKKMIATIAILFAIVLILIVKPWTSKPYEDTTVEDIVSVTVKLNSGTSSVDLEEHQIVGLLDLLQQLPLYHRMMPVPSSGGISGYSIIMVDKTEIDIVPAGEWISINGIRYKTEYDLSEQIDQFAHNILDTRFSE